jgi:mono/diheme cytochrome c family protein
VRSALLALCAMLLLTSCERAMQDMYNQPRYKPLRPSPLFPDGNSSRSPPAGSVPHAIGNLADTSSGRAGADEAQAEDAAAQATSMPFPITADVLRRGRDRFLIYCAPCHSPVGDGDGLVTHHGFPHPPSYHTDRLREAPDRHFFDVITNGYGIMYSYADRVMPRDRWAIVAYIRALQLSQHAAAETLPADLRAELARTGEKR